MLRRSDIALIIAGCLLTVVVSLFLFTHSLSAIISTIIFGSTKVTIFLVVLCSVALSTTWHWFRSRFLLKQWASANGFELVQMSINWYKFGPFLGSKRQEVYQIKVRDHKGRERSGWAKCGGYFLGLLVNEVEVIWD
jgi:hypothetical protein